jgi:DNA-binding response OmpR family regulator
MRILLLDDDNQDLAAIESALRLGEIEIRSTGAAGLPNVAPVRGALDWPTAAEGFYAFAGWTLDATARDLVSPSGQRIDLTSSEFDLLMAFIRQPGQTASRSGLLGALRGRAWTYFDRSIDTLVARLRKKIDADEGRPPLIRSVRGVGYVFCAAVSHQCGGARSPAA